MLSTRMAVVAMALLASSPAVDAQSPAPDVVGQVTHLAGVLAVRREGAPTQFLSIRSDVKQGDVLQTAGEAYARIKFQDGAEVVLRPGTQMKVDNYSYDEKEPDKDNAILSLVKGGMRSVTGLLAKRNRDKALTNTPTATVGIRGTHFGMLMCQGDCGGIATVTGAPLPNGLHVDVADGAVVLRNPAGQQVISAGQFGYAQDVRTPPVQVPPTQGIQVTMPPSISTNTGTGRGVGRAGENECAVGQ